MLIVFTVFLMFLIFTDTKLRLRDFFMLAGLTLLTFMTRRQASMFVIVCGFIFAKMSANFLRKYDKDGTDKVIIQKIKKPALFSVSCNCIGCHCIYKYSKHQIYKCNKQCIGKFSRIIGHIPRFCKIAPLDVPWQCQHMAHLLRTFQCNHDRHIKRSENAHHRKQKQKQGQQSVFLFFLFTCCLFHQPTFSSLRSNTRSWNTEIRTTTRNSSTALAD